MTRLVHCVGFWGCLLLGSALAQAGETVPFKETLHYVSSSPNGLNNYYVGQAAHLGKVNAVLSYNPAFDPLGDKNDPANPFATHLKTAANGDTLYGRVIPDDISNPNTTGTITIDGGTGRFAGVTGTTRYVISLSPAGIDVSVTGAMTSVGKSK